jgi:hypothetical protein
LPKTFAASRRVTVLIVVTLAVLAAGCGGDGHETGSGTISDVSRVEDAVRATFAAFNQQDAEAFLAGWTDGGFETTFAVPKEDAWHVFPGAVRFRRVVTFLPLGVDRFSRTMIRGEGATTEVELREGHIKVALRLSLVRKGGVWKIDRAVEIEAQAPDGAQLVRVEAKEFNFEFPGGFDSSQVHREVTFKVSNIGEQAHEFGVLVVLESGAEEFLGRMGPLDPGQSGTLILTNLEPGHYAMLCNLLDTQGDGRPHSAKGMRVDFEVQ